MGLSFGWAAAAHAATLVVSSSGPWTSLDEAFLASSPGDRIEVDPGTWPVTVAWPHRLEVAGAGAALTFIEGDGLGAALRLTGVEAAVLTGVGLKNAGASCLELQSSELQLEEVEILESGAEGGTGAVVLLDSTLALNDVTFRHNQGSAGGAIQGERSTLSGSAARFEENTVTNTGGAIFLLDSTVSLAGAHFEGNQAESGHGGAISVEGSALELRDSVLLSNTAGGNGGALSVAAGSALELVTTALSDNVATGNGGDLYLADRARAALADSEFIDSTSVSGYGGSVYATTNVGVVARRCTWSRPYSLYGGGAFYLYDTVQPTRLTDVVITEGESVYSVGGAIYAYYNSPVVAERSRFEGNVSSVSHGGAIYAAYYAELDLSDTEFVDNRAEVGSGGAIYLENYGGNPSSIVGGYYSGNVAGAQGGAAHIGSSYLTFSDNELRGNRAGDDSFGGALSLVGNYELQLDRNRLLLNRAGYGGAIYDAHNVSGTGHDTWRGNLFQENSARVGGAACLVENGSSSLENNTLVGNGASEAAGGLCVVLQGLRLVNNVFAFGTDGAALSLYDAPSVAGAVAEYNNFWQNSGGDIEGDGAELSDTNLLIDPGFQGFHLDADADADSLRLGAESPLIDAGWPELLDLDGSPSDIGAYGGPTAAVDDLDGDGVDARYDCDDTDAERYPGATERWYDGADQDCDGNDDDQDGDGLASADDCDDQDPGLGDDCDASPPDSEGGSRKLTKDADDPEGGCSCGGGLPPAGILPLGLGLLLLAGRRRP